MDTIQEMQTATQFDERLEQIWQSFERLNERMIPEIDNDIDALIEHPKEDMDVESYMKIMYMKGIKYKQEENKNAALFCAMRLLWMKKCFQDNRMKRPRLLDMTTFDIPNEMNAFIEQETNFLDEKFTNIRRKLLVLSIFLFVIFAAILVLFIHVTIVFACVESLLLCFLNYLIQKRRFPVLFMKNQSNAVEHYAQDNVVSFDRPFRI